MFTGSILGAILFTKKKYRDEWKSHFLKWFLLDIIFSTICGELISRIVLKHDTSFPILMFKVPSFGIKYMGLLFLGAIILPFILDLLYKIFSTIIRKLNEIADGMPTDKVFISSQKKENAIFLIFVVLVFGAIMLGTRVIWSGYHFMDDHNIISVMEMKGKYNLFEIIGEHIKWDLEIRFRPFYWVLYCIKIYLFEMHIAPLMSITMLEGALTCFILYRFARNIKSTQLEAAIFALLSVLGEQFAPWFRVPNTENDGFLIVALIFYLISDVYRFEKERHPVKKILIALLITLGSMQKEAFIIMIPAYLMMIMATYRIYGCKEKLIILMKREAGLIVYSLLLGAAELYIVVFKIGTNEIGYAGFNSGTAIGDYAKGICSSLFGDLKYNSLLLIVALLVIFSRGIYKKENKGSDEVKGLGWFLTTMIYVMATQLVLYAKSSMFDRYIIPYIVGWGGFCILYVCRMFRSRNLKYWIYMLLCVMLTLICLVDSFVMSRDWAKRGEDIGILLYTLRDELKEDSDADILVNIRAKEEEYSLVVWEEHYGDGNWKWTTLKLMRDENRLDEIKPRDYDLIVSHYSEYYQTDELEDKAFVNKDDYQEIHNINNEYVILRHK